METRTILVLLGLLVAPIATAGEAYVWTDDKGVVHYSDRPFPGATKIELAEPNTGQSPAPRRADAASSETTEQPAEDAAPLDVTVAIGALPDRLLVSVDNGGELNVSLTLNPPLRPGHQVRVYFDGNAQVVPGTSFQLSEVWRGVHNLQAEVLDETGRMLIRSQTNRFYVQQTTVR